MRQYEMCEITVPGKTPQHDWAEAAPDALFICGSTVFKTRGFVAENGIYQFRFLPDVPGVWEYTVSGCVNASGTVEVLPAAKGEHGAVRAVDCHFEHQDGSFFYPFGTTVYALIHQSEALYRQTMDTLSSSPFNKIRFCVFPKHFDYNHNEPRHYAFGKKDGAWNVKEPDFAFWRILEDAVLRLHNMGIQCDLILFNPYDRWGFSEFSRQEDEIYLDYLLRRLSAMPNVWWSMANEYDLLPKKDQARWAFIENYLASHDPSHHLIGNHNCFAFWDHSRKNITHVSVQTKALSWVPRWRQQYGKPVCIDECCYEGNLSQPWGAISGREMVFRFWRTVVNGGYCTHGETFYDDNDILWWARGGTLHGESPARIAFLRRIAEELPGPLEPWITGFAKLISSTPEQLEAMLAQAPAAMAVGLTAVLAMDPRERSIYFGAEPNYRGRVGDEAFLLFFDLCTCVRSEIRLPENKSYTLELIDVWNMTRERIAENVSGKVEFALPGKEGFALLATAK